MKTCSRCKQEKPLADFSARQSKCRDCYAAYFREYRANNRERTNQQSYRYIRSEKGKATQARYATSEVARSRHRLREHGRRAVIFGNSAAVISEKDQRRLMQQSCAECGGPGEHVDHIVPIARGGRHAIGNLQMLCARCNLSKGKKFIVEWRRAKTPVAA